ncbi:MAG: hypothetical protein HQL74_15390, partial [Magnetococcales bacterium]|nr:hypothetical protein [Magnetococcales bacterium]
MDMPLIKDDDQNNCLEARENERAFLLEYVSTGNALASYQKVFGENGENRSTVKSRATRLAKRLSCNQGEIPAIVSEVTSNNTLVAPLDACNQTPDACNQGPLTSNNTLVAPLDACNQTPDACNQG